MRWAKPLTPSVTAAVHIHDLPPHIAGDWPTDYIQNITAMGPPGALSAFSFHGYQHNCPDCWAADNVANMAGGGIDASKEFFDAVCEHNAPKPMVSDATSSDAAVSAPRGTSIHAQ